MEKVENHAQSHSSEWQILGHSWIVDLLDKVSASNDSTGPGHAYLFLGPRHVGKSTLAQSFAKALLCTAEGDRPCGQCRSCKLLERSTHPDLHFVQPVDKDGMVDRLDGTLRSEQAADIIHEVALRPLEGRYKIILIQDFQAANTTFANKLLKTLEEPPERVILLLTATDRSLVLPTILSRCQQFELRPVDTTTIEQALIAQQQVTPVKAKTLARLANGRFGWALQKLQQQNADEERQSQIETLIRLTRATLVERLAFSEKLASDRNSQHLFEMLELWLIWWRDVMLTQSNCADSCSNIDYNTEIATIANAISPEQTVKYVQILRNIEKMLHHTVNTRLALDVLLLKLPKVRTAA